MRKRCTPAEIDQFIIGTPILRKNTKLLPCQRERAIQLYDGGRGMNIQRIANMFKRQVSFHCIYYLLRPEKRQNIEELGGHRIYYDKEIRDLKNMRYRSRKNSIKHLLIKTECRQKKRSSPGQK